MANFHDAATKTFQCASGATGVPLTTDPMGSATAGDSTFITTPVVLESITILTAATGAATLTISDHAGTAGTDLVITCASGVPPAGTTIPYGSGADYNWSGIKAVSAASGPVVQVNFRVA